jgi:type II secretory ATPase GspE/PulE/Tfp pilus assembly ATPase PilB-like protein
MAQRLVRVICPKCIEEYKPHEETLHEMDINPKDFPDIKLARGIGCEYCANTGYRGRKGIYELMLINDDVRKLILSQADSKTIKDKAREFGMATLRESGWDKVKKHITSVAEVIRVTQVE